MLNYLRLSRVLARRWDLATMCLHVLCLSPRAPLPSSLLANKWSPPRSPSLSLKLFPFFWIVFIPGWVQSLLYWIRRQISMNLRSPQVHNYIPKPHVHTHIYITIAYTLFTWPAPALLVVGWRSKFIIAVSVCILLLLLLPLLDNMYVFVPVYACVSADLVVYSEIDWELYIWFFIFYASSCVCFFGFSPGWPRTPH